MPRAIVDTSVLFAAAYRRDAAHDDALPVLGGIDAGELPEGIVVDFVLAETLNGLTTHAGHAAAVDFLDRLEGNDRFHVESLNADATASAKAIFRRHEPLSFADACLVAYARTEGLDCLYALDDDFDRIDGIHRLETATNPYDPQ